MIRGTEAVSRVDHCISAHVSAEHDHRRALAAMSATALLELEMGLCEGTGAPLAAVLARTALHIHDRASAGSFLPPSSDPLL
ncbi:nicotinate-nucleotide--dimethylbenzimidazole phosphoribosyltransferase [Mesorhizobium sp.]|uniref:nicotinate-nucleotide--dimethylbenzimidazole phosphoribosyltransferase n=1 Tax=Mesorhizobium sp. TaxID=1871066 RepID=UPI0011F8F304|nr:nicotinate-nucleotide--dimethylbenzimidazole phosphoribosyltransferase [Mesorhizobium sp.]TIP14318.1 MAG: hypothetical protein E5X73_05395 [Mesorhizobium sp.]